MAPNLSRDAKGRQIAGAPGLNPKGRPPTNFAFTDELRRSAREPGRLQHLAWLVYSVATGQAVCIDAEWQREAAEAFARGESPPPRRGEVLQPDLSTIQRAWEFLAKYGGIATSTINVTIDGERNALFDSSKLSPDEIAAMERTLAKAAGYEGLPMLDVPSSDKPSGER